MIKPTQSLKQPSAIEMQALQQLLQSGQLPLAESKAQSLLKQFPQALGLLNMLAMAQQGQAKFQDAISSFRQILLIDPRIAEIHFNLAVLLAQQGDKTAAIAAYRQALQLKPQFTVAHFNLATELQAQGLLKEATLHYQQAIAQEPQFLEAIGNLGTLLQQRGQWQQAEQCYRRALALKPDARAYFNLGTILHDKGEHLEAIQAFEQALKLEPEFADAWNDLGETYRDRAQMDQALRCYREALSIKPDHSRALYNMGEFYTLAGQLKEAIPYFEASDFADAPERILQCYYKTEQFERFKAGFDALLQRQRATSVLMATLSTHYASNFTLPDPYNYCPSPMDYVLHSQIPELAEIGSVFLKDLLDDIQHLAIAERKQGRLYYGMQSAGNLLMRPEPSLQRLAALIREKIRAYQQQFAESEALLIQEFPAEIEFTSSWYLRMKQGGYLTSHIHEEGWISGCVYLQLPDNNAAHEGSFEYSTDGDDYPRLHDQFARQIVDLNVGDIVLFPSSLFHRTLPFLADQERVCVAFDIKPKSVFY